jgi:hypothetical protein
MKIEFTDSQAQNLVNLLDLAVKAGGLQVAAAAAEISNIIVATVQSQGNLQSVQAEVPQPLQKEQLIKEAPPREVSAIDI